MTATTLFVVAAFYLLTAYQFLTLYSSRIACYVNKYYTESIFTEKYFSIIYRWRKRIYCKFVIESFHLIKMPLAAKILDDHVNKTLTFSLQNKIWRNLNEILWHFSEIQISFDEISENFSEICA